jgi:hypothetical protein
LALNKLGRAAEARAAIESALVRDPLNAVTHANHGWACLQKGDTSQALEHFREALRLDAEFAMARHGIVECMKTRYLVYRVLLRFMLWMAGLSKPWQWALILGGAVAYLVLLFLVEKDFVPARLVWPVLIIYLAFGVLTWIADPLFNLLLRFDRFGRLALSPGQLAATNWIGACLLGAILGVLVAVFVGWPPAWLAAALCGLLVVPLTGVFNCPPGWARRAMSIYTIVVAVLGIVGVVLFAVLPDSEESNWTTGFLVASVLGIFLSGGVALVLLTRQRRD